MYPAQVCTRTRMNLYQNRTQQTCASDLYNFPAHVHFLSACQGYWCYSAHQRISVYSTAIPTLNYAQLLYTVNTMAKLHNKMRQNNNKNQNKNSGMHKHNKNVKTKGEDSLTLHML